MFTGLVEELGSITEFSAPEVGAVLTVECPIVVSDAAIGDSVCVNGCCLTVINKTDTTLTFEAGTETLQRTNLGELQTGATVNLERSLRPTDRMGGHYVTGHIDATATIRQRNDEGEWSEFRFAVARELTSQMASKGSVAVDGISLTLVDVTEYEFSVALIPHTLKVTTLGSKTAGDRVNIETDLLAKYVQQQLKATSHEPG